MHKPEAYNNKEELSNAGEWDHLDDDVLMAQMAKDDEQAFALLMNKYHSKLKALGWRVLFNDQAAEDAVQEAFLALWRTRHKWEIGGAAKLSTWLYRVTINRCVDIKRKRRVKVDIEDTTMSVEAKGDDILEAKHRQVRLDAFLKELPEQQALALRLYYLEENSIPAIAKSMDNTEDGVRSLIKRGKANMRQFGDELSGLI